MRVYVLFAQTNKCQNFSRIFLLYVFFVDRELRKSYLFLFMQLNSSMIGQRYNVCIAGKRFLILSLSKALGLKRFVTAVLISLSEKKNCCIFHPRQISRGKCYICVLFYRKMIKSSTLCASMDQQNGLSQPSHCLAAQASNAERGIHPIMYILFARLYVSFLIHLPIDIQRCLSKQMCVLHYHMANKYVHINTNA